MRNVVALSLLAFSAAAVAQQKPPIAQYWMSVETNAPMSIPGMPVGMMGGQGQDGRSIRLDLGSQRSADGPNAAHEIPSGMNMGPSLPLATPQTTRRDPVREREYNERENMPKGRWLIYWGCGEATRPGQPVVVDMANLAQGRLPPGFATRLNSGVPPNGRTNGHWPNSLERQPKPVPDNASLLGDHTIRGNYTPDIRFTLGQGHDFMERVALTTASLPAGGASVRWNSVSTATGYSAMTFGSDNNDVVVWSSSDVQTWAMELRDYIAPGDVARLIREKVLLSPQTTECAVPADVVKKSGGSPMLNFVAYGPEANFGFPARPKDPEWYAKVRFKSTASAMLGMAAERGGRRPQRAEQGRAPAEDQSAQQPAAPAVPSGVDAVKEGVNILRGIFGR